MIDFSKAFKEACFDLMTISERRDYIFGNIDPNKALLEAAEKYRLIKSVNELSKMVKYGI